jgi:hypothetical protein
MEANMCSSKSISFEYRLSALVAALAMMFAMAPVAAQNARTAEVVTMDSADLANARGKFANGNVTGMNIIMHGTWQDAQQGQLEGEVRVQIQPGAAQPVVVQSSAHSSGSVPNSPAGTVIGTVPNVQGLAQGNQIAGFNNQVNNQFEISVLPATESTTPMMATGSSNASAHSGAGTVEAGVGNGGVGVRIRPTGGGQTVQQLGSQQGQAGAQQWAQVPSNANLVNLSTSLELRMSPQSIGDIANQSTRQALDMMPARVR